MASDTSICNLALSHFGQEGVISSIDPPDGSDEAAIAKDFYPLARDEILEEYDWTFARKRDTLASVTNDRTDLAYKFALPADYLKARRLLPLGYADDQNDAAEYEIEGDFLYTNEATPTLIYTKRLVDMTKMAPLAVIALSYRLAAYMAGPIVKDPTGNLQRMLRTAGDAEAEKAKQSDAGAERRRATHKSTAKRSR